MKLMIQPCTNLIPERVEVEDFKDIVFDFINKMHVASSISEDIDISNWDDADLRGQLGKSVAESIVMGLTVLKAMERMDGIPKNFVPAVMAQVFYEHYAKGYHDVGFELDFEED